MDAQKKELDYKINWTQALAKMRNCGVVNWGQRNAGFANSL